VFRGLSWSSHQPHHFDVNAAGHVEGVLAVMLDVPDRHEEFAQWLENHGFAKERPLMRMMLGSGTPLEIHAK
jgi:hypothetical protein